MAQYCRTCGKQVSEENKFCPGCGAQLYPHTQFPEPPTQTIQPPEQPVQPPVQPVQPPVQPVQPPVQPVQPPQAYPRQPVRADLHAQYTYFAPPQGVIPQGAPADTGTGKKHTGAIISIAAVAVLAILALIVMILRPWESKESKNRSDDNTPTAVLEEDETERTPQETIQLLFEAMATGSEAKLKSSVSTFLIEKRFSDDLQETLEEMKDEFIDTYGKNAKITVSCEGTERWSREEMEEDLMDMFGISPADYGITEMICVDCAVAIGDDELDSEILLVRENGVWKVLDLDG